MERSGIASQICRFGLFEVDLTQGTLTRQGAPVKLQEQPFLVLAMLLEHPGEIVTREDLRHKLWPQGTFVDFDGSLNAVLKRLRAALNDDPDQPRFIETVPKRGYRFICPSSRGWKKSVPLTRVLLPQPLYRRARVPGLAGPSRRLQFGRPLNELRSFLEFFWSHSEESLLFAGMVEGGPQGVPQQQR